jgi:hypothetical protein
MVATVGGLLTDPDSLSYELATVTSTTTKELVIDVTNKKIKLTRTGNLTADGVTLRCLYSKLKELWISDANLIPQPFPFDPITNEQYDMINGWNFDANLNPTTKITISACTGTVGDTTITTSNNFNTANVFVDAFVSGTGIGTDVKVASIESNTSIELDTIHSGNISTALTFYSDIDYSYNLIRTGGWALKDTDNTTSLEEWMGVISLGRLGAEGLTKTLITQRQEVGNSTILLDSVTGIVEGSYVHGATIPYGTKVLAVNTGNSTITMTKTTGTLSAGAIITIKPKDRPYYQIGANALVKPVDTIQWGQVNQPIKIYGGIGYGNVDLRTANVATFFSREERYQYAATTAEDVGIDELTYQTYRFGLETVSDELKITHNDSVISSTGVLPTGSPYNNMSITWYANAQPRNIGGTSYDFNVIIDANVALGNTTTYGSATAEQIYEYVQWALRRSYGTDIDQGSGVKWGVTTRELVEFVGDTLYTIYDSNDGGVYIDHFAKEDINRIVFSDNTNRTFPYVSFGRLTFNEWLTNDDDEAVYQLFYKQINQGSGSLAHGTKDALIVKAFSSDPSGDGTNEIRGNLIGALSTVTFDYDWDENEQCSWIANNAYYEGDEYRIHINSQIAWYRATDDYTSGNSWATLVDGVNSEEITGPTVMLVAVGRTNGQYASNDGTIAKSNNNLIDIQATRERNYAT